MRISPSRLQTVLSIMVLTHSLVFPEVMEPLVQMDRRKNPDATDWPGWIEGRSILGATGDGKKLDGSYQLHEVGRTLDKKALNF